MRTVTILKAVPGIAAILFALGGIALAAAPGADGAATAKATFAGGCFWCMEPPFDILPYTRVTAQ